MAIEDLEKDGNGEVGDGVERPGILAEHSDNPIGGVLGDGEKSDTELSPVDTDGVDNINQGMVTRWLLDSQDVAMSFELFSVCGYFDEMVHRLNLQDSPAFSNQDLQQDFRERLNEFNQYLDKEIASLKKILRGNEECSKFSDDWEGHIKKAAYYAFFMHYGEKRRGEVSARTGKLKDYVYHVVRSAFNALGRKMRFFDEKTFLTTILHDTKEEYGKGFLALLAVDEEIPKGELFSEPTVSKMKGGGKKIKDNKQIFFDQFKRFCDELEMDLGDLSVHGELTISELIDLLTKETKDRNRTLLEIFYKICLMSDDPQKQFSAMRAVMAKIADRLDNIRSLSMDPGKKETGQEGGLEGKRKSMIEDETVYVFLALAKKFNMVNVSDWFYDYLYFKDLKHRKEHGKLRRKAHLVDDESREDANLLSEFADEFRTRLNAEFHGVGYDEGTSVYDIGEKVKGSLGERKMMEEGTDYVLSFREIGKRFEDHEHVHDLLKRGKYGLCILNFVIFHPVNDNPKLADCARRAFMKIFSSNIEFELDGVSIDDKDRSFFQNEQNKPELDTDLGELMLEKGQGKEFQENNYSNRYGVGVWAVFDSEREAFTELLGDYHEGVFYDDVEGKLKRDEVLGFWKNLLPEVAKLRRFYNEYFSNQEGQTSVDALASSARRQSLVVLKPYIEEQDLKVSELLSILIMTLFMEREEEPVKINVNGMDHLVRLPNGSRLSTAFIYTEPLLVGRRMMVPHGNDDQALEETEGLDPVDDNAVHIEVDSESVFNVDLFYRQTEQLYAEILPAYRESLIGRNMPVI